MMDFIVSLWSKLSVAFHCLCFLSHGYFFWVARGALVKPNLVLWSTVNSAFFFPLVLHSSAWNSQNEWLRLHHVCKRFFAQIAAVIQQEDMVMCCKVRMPSLNGWSCVIWWEFISFNCYFNWFKSTPVVRPSHWQWSGRVDFRIK